MDVGFLYVIQPEPLEALLDPTVMIEHQCSIQRAHWGLSFEPNFSSLGYPEAEITDLHKLKILKNKRLEVKKLSGPTCVLDGWNWGQMKALDELLNKSSDRP